jgi:8-oxo-dGTP pyrophosphatase MutT (NUDIX family)
MSKECTGAGIICFFDNRGIKQRYVSGLDKDILYLCLETHDMSIDFPKGGRDFGEHPIDCATRETFEEINLSTDDYFFVEKTGELFYTKDEKGENALQMFVAEIKIDSLSKLKIKPNLHTSPPVIEHKGFSLKSSKDLSNSLLEYLKEPFKWGNNIVLEYLEA